MHRLIQDHLEEVLREPDGERLSSPASEHLTQCAECREEISAMRRHSTMFRALRAPEASDQLPRSGFYARVMERIEAQRPIDIWQLFFDSAFGRRIAIGSMAVALLFSLYLVSSEHFAQPVSVSVEDHTGIALPNPDRDTVLVDLVTYREQ